jgi:tRNA (guanine-N7-)-methyltransferase
VPQLETPATRPVLSFKPRRGRMTSGQRRAIETLWSAYGVEVSPGLVDLAALFGRDAPLVLEIGFGMGEATAAMAAADPGRDVLAVDVHTPGAGALMQRVHDDGTTNVRVAIGDAVDVLRCMLAPGSLDEIRIFFPDPWPKAKHVKRRLVSAEFAALAADRLTPGGALQLATDWAPYADQMLTVVAGDPLLHNPFAGFAPRPAARPETRFERIGLARGHAVFDVIAHRLG